MRKLITLLAIVSFTLSANAQEKGDWYVGTGDIANKPWMEWSVTPTIGYGITENLMVGAAANQEVEGDLEIDIHARYFVNGYFVYLGSNLGLDTDQMDLGVGKMFTLHKNVYVDPKIVYNTGEKTTNLMLGFGLKF